MSNEQLALRIKAGEDVADNMLKLWQQNQGMIEEILSHGRKGRSEAGSVLCYLQGRRFL